MIAVQAETARLTTPGMPAAGAQRLAEIGDTARAGLTEMRRLLGVLREDAQAYLADRHPQPGLEQSALIPALHGANARPWPSDANSGPSANPPGTPADAAAHIVSGRGRSPH